MLATGRALMANPRLMLLDEPSMGLAPVLVDSIFDTIRQLHAGGTTILQAIQGAVSKNTRITYSLDGAGAEGASAGIVVVGEKPYAEGVGDRADL